MDSEGQLKATQTVMMCDNCGHPVIQWEVDENRGKCPNCNATFHPFDNLSE